MIEAFTYCWTDHKTTKLYVGIHKGTTTDGYICSSKSVLAEYAKRPNDFTRQIIASGLWCDMISFERAILKSVNAKQDPLFYNEYNADGKLPYRKGKKQTEEARAKRRTTLKANGTCAWNKGKSLSSEHIAHLKASSPKTRSSRSQETKNKISEKLKGRNITWGNKISIAKRKILGC